MIKCKVTIIGTVSRGAEIKTSKDGSSFIAFGIQTVLGADSDDKKTMDISVAMDGNDVSKFDFMRGSRVCVEGNLSLRKRDDITYYNLSCDSIKSTDEPKDNISGTMSFKGTLSSKEINEREGKKGAYRYFDAFSTEKDGDKFVYTWVHFIDFSSVKPEWLQPKTGIDAEGELEFSVYNGRESLNCRIDTLTLWDKSASRQ